MATEKYLYRNRDTTHNHRSPTKCDAPIREYEKKSQILGQQRVGLCTKRLTSALRKGLISVEYRISKTKRFLPTLGIIQSTICLQHQVE